MAKTISAKRAAAARPSPVPPGGEAVMEDGRGGAAALPARVAIDRYVEALRKGVMLSQ